MAAMALAKSHLMRDRIAQKNTSVRVCAAALAASHATRGGGTLFAIARQRLATARQSDAT